MCGICGEVAFAPSQPAPDVVSVMTERLASRGPDDEGILAHGDSICGHRRLAIIDLSPNSAQPMADRKLGLTVVFNGEIYNYRELRKDLEAHGYSFFSEGDTEVLLKAYHHWGDSFVEKLQGMFAFAIREARTGRVLLGRDRLGIKPLYYELTPQRLRFASTLPALVAAGDLDTSIDPVGLHHYMTFHSVVPSPHTLLKGVRKLPPATTLAVEPDGSSRRTTYWKLSFEPDHGPSAEQWQERIREGLMRSVRRRLVADVPVGVLLSGGLDSSLLTAMLAESGQDDLRTFSIGFESVGDEDGNEFRYSDLIAEKFGTDHHRMTIAENELLDTLPDCIADMSEPMVSHDAIGFYLLSREVSKHVKVVQSGQGADEVFAGYHWYPPLAESKHPLATYAEAFFDGDHAGFTEAVSPDFVEDDYSRAYVAEHFAAAGADHPVDKALRLDQQVMLVDDPVKRVDNMTMAFGLEARVPFLDHELVELAASIPAGMKLASGGKGILKDAARPLLPNDVIDRPKGYFPVPGLKYLRGRSLDFVREVLHDPAAKNRGLFRSEYVEKLLENPEQHITPLRGSRLWQLAVLESWLQTHHVG